MFSSRISTTTLRVLILILVCSFLSSAQAQTTKVANTQPKPVAKTTASVEPLAEIDGEQISSADIEKTVGLQIAGLQDQIYNLKLQKIESIIDEKLLAKEAAKRGITVAALLDAEVTAKVTLVTEKDIDAVAGTDQSVADPTNRRVQIRNFLQNQRIATQRDSFLKSLRSQAKIVMYLKAPIYRMEVAVDDAPALGPATAPVTIVEFSDFQCPFCRSVKPTIDKVLARYGDKVRLIYKNLPLDSLHPLARRAAEAGQCANEQGKFWPFHDKLYAGAFASAETLKAAAEELNLDAGTFEQCLNTRKYKATVQKDVDYAATLGVTGTPSFFVNGRPLIGAQSFESFVRVIDEELSQPSKKGEE